MNCTVAKCTQVSELWCDYVDHVGVQQITGTVNNNGSHGEPAVEIGHATVR